MKIDLVKSAEKELLRLDKKTGEIILSKIKLLAKNPYGQDSQKLGGGKGYRIRFGDYRIIYAIDKKSKTITVARIRHRKDAYKKLRK